MTNKEFWFWYYWMKFKEVKLVKLGSQMIEFKTIGIRRIFNN